MLYDMDANQFPTSHPERAEMANAQAINQISSRRRSPAFTHMAEAASRAGGPFPLTFPSMFGGHFNTATADFGNTKHSLSSRLVSLSADKPLLLPGSR